MKVVAIIPARGGSQRIPRKNIRFFAGQPILAYSIAAAKATGLFDRIIVSTESEEIAHVAVRYGAEIPFSRPVDLAGDFVLAVEVVLHAVDWLRNNGGCDYACCIYATAPFIDPFYVRRGFERLRTSNASSAISVAEFAYPIERALRMNSDGRVSMIWPEHRKTRSQDLPVTFHDAAQFYWVRVEEFLQEKNILLSRPVAVVLPRTIVHDLDTIEDWEIAERKFQALRYSPNLFDSPFADLPAGTSEIVLGTAQLGFTYGVANRRGKPDARTANCMLCAAWNGGIRVYDTAQAYGDSEYVLGDFFAGSYGFSDARFISKLHPDIDIRKPLEIRSYVEESLRRLKSSSIWALMLHREKQLDHLKNEEIDRSLLELRKEGLFRHFGVSTYSPSYAQQALASDQIAILEVPANVFDRRMRCAGVNEIARQKNKMVIVRSVFLQGLATLNPGDVPSDIPMAREAVSALVEFVQRIGSTPIDFAYDYIRATWPGSLIVLGAETTEQIARNCQLPLRPLIDPEVVAAWDKFWPEDFASLCDPSTWPSPEKRLGFSSSCIV